MTSEEFRTDPLFLRNQFKPQGIFEIPLIKREKISLEDVELIGYDKLNENDTEKIVHFFLTIINLSLFGKIQRGIVIG